MAKNIFPETIFVTGTLKIIISSYEHLVRNGKSFLYSMILRSRRLVAFGKNLVARVSVTLC